LPRRCGRGAAPAHSELLDYDRTPLPAIYARARELPAEALATWRRALADTRPPSPAIRRVVDLGCGTGRFTGLLADLYGTAVVGVEPSHGMLAGREPLDPAHARFLAATAEALPLAAGAVDLVFVSMVYHHFAAPPVAVAELARAVRPGGHVMVRNPTRESADAYDYVRFFPDARAFDLRRMPSREGLAQAFQAHGFERRGHRIVHQLFATSYEDYYRKISLRGLSSLQAISDEAFARGLAAFETHCRTAGGAGPIYEPVELFVFRRA
jgi:ubiquinone/menaquinone biosynthesis C-methylase UbiE